MIDKNKRKLKPGEQKKKENHNKKTIAIIKEKYSQETKIIIV